MLWRTGNILRCARPMIRWTRKAPRWAGLIFWWIWDWGIRRRTRHVIRDAWWALDRKIGY